MMKKRISIFIALILVFSFAGTALAAEFSAQLYDEGQVDPYPGDLGHVSITNDDTAIDARNAFDALFQDWEMNGYPDDVGNVYYDDATGNIVITLVNGTEARRQEILAMAGNAEGIGFGESKYSYNRMLAVQQEIQADMAGAADKVHSVGVGWGSDADGNVAGFGESGKEARVVVTVAESALDEYRGAYEAKYGDMVYVVSGTAPVLLEENTRRFTQSMAASRRHNAVCIGRFDGIVREPEPAGACDARIRRHDRNIRAAFEQERGCEGGRGKRGFTVRRGTRKADERDRQIGCEMRLNKTPRKGAFCFGLRRRL